MKTEGITTWRLWRPSLSVQNWFYKGMVKVFFGVEVVSINRADVWPGEDSSASATTTWGTATARVSVSRYAWPHARGHSFES